MKNLLLGLIFMLSIIFSFLILFSCNNEELYSKIEQETVEEIIEEEEEEEENVDEEDVDEEVIIPIAVDDTVTTTENISININILANDTEIPSDGVIILKNPSNGTVIIIDNDTPNNPNDDLLLYTPNDSYIGVDTFEYSLCDNLDPQNCDTALVTVNINEIEDDIATELKAFPTAYGGGAYATGGRGGSVYHVTNLNNSGAGSFRDAISKSNRIIVFDVSGTINLTSNIVSEADNITIAGQTAPVGGITITGNEGVRFRMQDCNNIIMRYIRIRPLESNNDAFEFYGNTDGAYNIILDHVSASYGGDETLSIRGAQTHNITFQRCLIAETKTGSLFGDSQTQNYSYDNSFLNSLFWNVSHRTPNVASDGRVDVINNVTQNWQYRLTYAGGDIELNHINNYYAMGGRNGLGSSQIQLNPLVSAADCQIYTAGNIIDKGMFTDPSADNKALWVEFESGQQTKYAPDSEFVSTQYSQIGAPLPIKSATEAYADVITNVGANASLNADGSISSSLDVNDTDYLNIMAQGEGAYESYQMNGNIRSWFGEQRYSNFVASISSTPINTRPENYDTDGDGMPDEWETNNGYNPGVNDAAEDRDNDGYTNLEEFLNLVDSTN